MHINILEYSYLVLLVYFSYHLHDAYNHFHVHRYTRIAVQAITSSYIPTKFLLIAASIGIANAKCIY